MAATGSAMVAHRSSCFALGALLLLAACQSLQGDCRPLAGEEIERLFADVVDRAVVVEGSGGEARNLWCANGRFESRWQTASGSGVLTGGWWVEGNMRCVRMDQALPDGSRTTRCGALLLCGSEVRSQTASGGIHGRHTLEPLDDTRRCAVLAEQDSGASPNASG